LEYGQQRGERQFIIKPNLPSLFSSSSSSPSSSSIITIFSIINCPFHPSRNIPLFTHTTQTLSAPHFLLNSNNQSHHPSSCVFQPPSLQLFWLLQPQPRRCKSRPCLNAPNHGSTTSRRVYSPNRPPSHELTMPSSTIAMTMAFFAQSLLGFPQSLAGRLATLRTSTRELFKLLVGMVILLTTGTVARTTNCCFHSRNTRDRLKWSLKILSPCLLEITAVQFRLAIYTFGSRMVQLAPNAQQIFQRKVESAHPVSILCLLVPMAW
jgi:hypothetical protein